MDMHLKYDNMHENGMFYALICINNHVSICINFMLSRIKDKDKLMGAIECIQFVRRFLCVGLG